MIQCITILTQIALCSCINIFLDTNFERVDFPQTRIVGGGDCEVDYPFMVSLQKKGINICGGSLVKPQWVLTAAHCGADFVAVIGKKIISNSGYNKDEGIKVDYVVAHPGFDETSIVNDIAMAHLLEPVNDTELVRLPSKDLGYNLIKTCNKFLVMGWGSRTENGKLSNTLQCVFVDAMNKDKCRKILGIWRESLISGGTFCANSNKRDACYGDSGGPLLCKGVQYGIVSWGIGCATGDPAVYTSVGHYLNFIRTLNKANLGILNFKIFLMTIILLKILF